MESVALGQTIKELREEKGLTQEQLANMLHISRQNVSRWELGKRSIESTNLLKICQILGVTLDELALKAVNKSSAKKEKNNYTDFIEKQNESDLINLNIKDDKKKSVKQKTNRSPISVNKNDIYNIVVNLYDDKNQESKKRKKYFRLFISSMVLMVILIIFFIIFSLYNAVSIYNINGSGSSIDIVNGLFVITRDKIYFDLGSIRNKTKNEIRELELYYYNKNNDRSLIFKTDDFSDSNIILYDFIGYNEYFKFDEMDMILNNLSIDILLSNETTETIRFNIEKEEFSKLFNKREEPGGIGEKTNKVEPEDTELEKFVKKNFNKADDGYAYVKKDGKRRIEYIYLDRNLTILVIDGDILESWNFDCIDEELMYQKLKKTETLESIIVDKDEEKNQAYLDEFNNYLNMLKSDFPQ